jgi:hypothetical protein
VQWPDRAESHPALIPIASDSVKVVLKGQTADIERVLVVSRPQTQGVIDNVPTGNYTAVITAHPGSDGSGTAQASATRQTTVNADQTTSLSVTLESTIDYVEVTPVSSEIWIDQIQTLTATAFNSADEIVLVNSFTWTIDDGTSFVSLQNIGDTQVDVAGNATGTALISATEPESGASAQCTVNVVPAKAEVRWRYSTDSKIVCAPAAAGAVVYFGTEDGRLFALDLTGNLVNGFPVQLNGPIVASPVILPTAQIIAATAAGTASKVYSIGVDGSTTWAYDLAADVRACPTWTRFSQTTGQVGILDDSGLLSILDWSTGSLQSSYNVGASSPCAPAIGLGLETVVAAGSSLLGIDGGTNTWAATGQWDTTGVGMALGLNDTAFAPTDNGLTAVNFPGAGSAAIGPGISTRQTQLQPTWSGNIPGVTLRAAPIINGAGTALLAGGTNGLFYSIGTSDGSIEWSADVGAPIVTTAAQDNSGRVYVPSNDGRLHAIDPSWAQQGQPVRWSFDVQGTIGAAAVTMIDDIYVPTLEGDLVAVNRLDSDSIPATAGPWPQFQYDATHAGWQVLLSP